jgi:hypothetical protein
MLYAAQTLEQVRATPIIANNQRGAPGIEKARTAYAKPRRTHQKQRLAFAFRQNSSIANP